MDYLEQISILKKEHQVLKDFVKEQEETLEKIGRSLVVEDFIYAAYELGKLESTTRAVIEYLDFQEECEDECDNPLTP